MKNIFISGLIAAIITGCVIISNDMPSPSPVSSPTANPSVTPINSSIPSSSSPTPSVSPVVSPTPVVTVKGTLEGKFTVGPLCPVEPCNISDDQKRQAYEARTIQIFLPDGKTLVTEFFADYKTETYQIELDPGTYTVNVTNAGISNFTPKAVLIEANKVTVLDINIDTGIR